MPELSKISFGGTEVKYGLILVLAVVIVICGCSAKTVRHCEKKENNHVGVCRQIVDDSYLYALLSVNSYEDEENTPFILPENIREVRHADSQISKPSEKYIHTKVYDNGSFQAKVFEIACGDREVCGDRLVEIVIAYRGTTSFLGPDMV